MRKLVHVKMNDGDRRSVRLPDCNRIVVYKDPDGVLFARVPIENAAPSGPQFGYVEIPDDGVARLLRQPPEPRLRRPAPRNEGKTAACLDTILAAFRNYDDFPTHTELKDRHGYKSRNPAYDAYDLFYDSSEYRQYIASGGAPWGPQRFPKLK
jgi:hypothetical protein